MLGIVAVAAVILIAGGLWLAMTHRADLLAGKVPIIPSIAVQLIVEFLVVAAILFILPRLTGFSLRELGFRAPKARDLLVGVLAAIIMAAIVYGSERLVQLVFHTNHEQNVIVMFKQVRDPATFAFFSVFAVMLAPLAEEMIFRVFVFNIAMRYGGFWIGAFISGILFGLSHGDAYAFLPLTFGGVILAGAYYRTRNVFTSVITHGLFNSLTVIALLPGNAVK